MVLGRVVAFWRSRVHPAASGEQVAAAFAFVAGGAVLGVLGVIVVVLGDAFVPRPSWIRQVGFMAAAGGLPLFLTGLVIGLPSRLWINVLTVVGMGASVVGIGIFAVLYPERWHVTVQAPNAYALGAYLVGVSASAASSMGALGSYLVERARPAVGKKPARGEVSDEAIREDLEWASKQGWGWGGVKRDSRRDVNVRLKAEEEQVDFLSRGRPFVMERREDPTTAKAVRALSNLRGTKKPSTGSDVEDQVGHLKRLQREQREAKAKRRASFWWKLTHPLAWWRGR